VIDRHDRGANPFTKDTVRRLLLNRFYLGELPDGHGGWLPGRHPVIRAQSGRSIGSRA
jgi:hypothetical protein